MGKSVKQMTKHARAARLQAAKTKSLSQRLTITQRVSHGKPRGVASASHAEIAGGGGGAGRPQVGSCGSACKGMGGWRMHRHRAIWSHDGSRLTDKPTLFFLTTTWGRQRRTWRRFVCGQLQVSAILKRVQILDTREKT